MIVVQKTSNGSPGTRGWETLILGGLLAIVTVVAYLPALKCGFVSYDDPSFVTENSHVQTGITLASIRWALSSVVEANWHPVTMLSHMVDYQLFGMNAGMHHLTNLLIHIGNTLLLFLVLTQCTCARWRSAIVAALFALHPLHVESVVWIAERKDVLSALFWLLTMWAYIRYVKGTRPKTWYSVALICFALGLMSKAMVVTVPFVLLLMDVWPLQRIAVRGARTDGRREPFKQLLLEKLPFFCLSAVFSVITYLVQKGAGAMMNGEARPLAARIGNALVSYATYLRKAAWPDDLAALYIHRKSSLGYVIGAAAILLAITAITILMHRRAAYLAMGWLWYLGTLVPVIGIVQVGSQTMADRFTYLPLVGIFIAVVWGIADICGNARAHLPYVYFARFGIAVILSVFSILTWRQIYFWRDSEALYKRILAVYPYTGSAHYDLGLVYSAQNKRAQAIEQYQAAVRCNPEKPEPRYNLGRELMLAGRLAEAREQCEMTLHYHPRFDEAEYTLAMVLVKSGDAAEALGHFKAATQINPSRSQYFNDLGVCCANLGQITNAIAAFENATQLDPKNSDAQRNLAQARADSHTNSVPNSQK